MSTTLGPGQVFCNECGAQNDARAERCWLCYSPLPAVTAEIAYAEVVEKPFVEQPQASGTVVALQVVAGLVAVLMLLVGIGAFAQDRMLGIVYCMVVTPAVLIGVVSFLIARRKSGPATAAPKGSGAAFTPSPQPESAKPYAVGLSSFLMSLAATVGAVIVAAAIAVLIAAAMIIALIAQCFAGLGGGH